MGDEDKPKRKLVDITLEEAIEVMRLGERYYHYPRVTYQLRRKTNTLGITFAQLFCVFEEGEQKRELIAANFSDTENAVTLCQGAQHYRTYYRIIKFLESKGFDLESADSRDR